MNKDVKKMTKEEARRLGEELAKNLSELFPTVTKAVEESKVEEGVVNIKCISCDGEAKVFVLDKKARQMGCECGFGMFLD